MLWSCLSQMSESSIQHLQSLQRILDNRRKKVGSISSTASPLHPFFLRSWQKIPAPRWTFPHGTIRYFPGGISIHNMLVVRVCLTHMGVGRFSSTLGRFGRNLYKKLKIGVVTKIHHQSESRMQFFCYNCKRVTFRKPDGRPPSFHKLCSPGVYFPFTYLNHIMINDCIAKYRISWKRFQTL